VRLNAAWGSERGVYGIRYTGGAKSAKDCGRVTEDGTTSSCVQHGPSLISRVVARVSDYAPGKALAVAAAAAKPRSGRQPCIPPRRNNTSRVRLPFSDGAQTVRWLCRVSEETRIGLFLCAMWYLKMAQSPFCKPCHQNCELALYRTRA
jgi:hypothetical protein